MICPCKPGAFTVTSRAPPREKPAVSLQPPPPPSHVHSLAATLRKGSSCTSSGQVQQTGHCGVLPIPTKAGGRRGGGPSSASGKQSGPNWSLTGLTCLHLGGGSCCLARCRPSPLRCYLGKVTSPRTPAGSAGAFRSFLSHF